MRIIIETDEQGKLSQAIASDAIQPATADAGGPSVHLLSDLASSPRSAPAVEYADGGAPPEWLLQAVAATAASDGAAGDGTAHGENLELTDGGGAPAA